MEQVTPNSASGFQSSCPGKVFILGEYAAVAGKPALVAAVGPRFKLIESGVATREANELALKAAELGSPKKVRSTATFPFAAGSPAGRLYTWALAQLSEKQRTAVSFQLSYEDPHQGRGGFGGSTAEFILTYKWLSQSLGWDDSRNRWQAAWKVYRELTAGEPLPPSGADLVSQWRGGVSLFDPEDLYCVDLWPIFDWSSVLVFSAAGLPGRKVATHEHLSSIGSAGSGKALGDLLVERLEDILLEGVRGVREGNHAILGHAMNDYADVLWESGLENASAHADRIWAKALPDVLGVKGAGAMLSDSMIVLMKPRSEKTAQTIAVFEARGLVLVAEGLPAEMGAALDLETRSA